jgi:hypothetical protein
MTIAASHQAIQEDDLWKLILPQSVSRQTITNDHHSALD